MHPDDRTASLIAVFPNNLAFQQEHESYCNPGSFASRFLFEIDPNVEGPVSSRAGFLPISPEDLGRSVLNRLYFFADAADVPFLLAPLLVRAAWKPESVGDVILAYPGVPLERSLLARDMMREGCEAVLLRRGDEPPVVLALARNARNERMVEHWADCIERFTPDECRQSSEGEPLSDRRMVERLCDRVGSIKSQGTLVPFAMQKPGHHLPEMVQEAITALLHDSEELREDPLGNALSVLNSPAPGIECDPGCLVTRLAFFIWSERADLKTAFDLSHAQGRRDFINWYLDRAEVELGIGPEFIGPVREAGAAPVTAAPDVPARFPAKISNPKSSEGLNLIGYARAEMGMGEQLRSCASALESVEIPFCINDFNHGIIASNRDAHYSHLIRPDNPFDVNLFHINADQIGLALEKFGPAFFRDRYNIGYWEWELSTFPDAWLPALDQMDEIWAPSNFIADAISGRTSKPVVWMPLAVEFPSPLAGAAQRGLRSQFKLPEQPFLFLFAFDFSSFATRKNYRAVIEAFERAFPQDDRSVGLVLKVIRHAHHKKQFWDLLEAVGDDRRIHIIDQVLRKQDVRELIATCDSLLSLHRSEGFGLAIAEAMYIGKPVIATNYSGNIDFTKSDNSCLVNFKLVPVKQGEYVHGEGQIWADPDIEQAAWYMRRLTQDREYGAQLGKRAARFIRRHHSSRTVGNRYAARLKQISAARRLLSFSEVRDVLPSSYSPVDRAS